MSTTVGEIEPSRHFLCSAFVALSLSLNTQLQELRKRKY